jgi:hypothetical protein
MSNGKTKWMKNILPVLGDGMKGATGWMVQIRFPVEQEFSLLHPVETGSEIHSGSYPMGALGFFPKGTAAGEISR